MSAAALSAISNMHMYLIPCGVYVMLDNLENAIKDNNIMKIKMITDTMMAYSIPCGFMLEITNIRNSFSIVDDSDE